MAHGVPGDLVATHFGVAKREAQIRRFKFGLIKPSPMHAHWARLIARAEGKKPTAKRATTKKAAK